MNHIEILISLNPCKDAIEWAKGYDSLEHAWSECKRPDWMLWLDRKIDLFTDKERRLMACRFVRETPIGNGKTVWDLLVNERSRNAVIVAKKFANGEVTHEDLRAASDAASDAAWDAASDAWDAASDAASDAAWDAARAARAASDAASDAAWDAASDAAWDAARAARAAAWDAARAAQSDIIRSYGNPFNENTKIKSEI